MREGTEGGEEEGRKEINVLTQNALRLSLSSSTRAAAATAPSLQPFAGSADVTASVGGGVHAPADRVHDAIDAAAGEVGDRGNRSPMSNS